MLKRVLFFVFCFICLGSFSLAESKAYEYGFYTVSNKEIISQTDEKVVISFDITNNTSNYYPELFAVPTLQVNGAGTWDTMYFNYINYDARKFSLDPNETKKISFGLEIPNKFPKKQAMVSVEFYSITHKISSDSEKFYLRQITSDFDGFLEGELFSYWKLGKNEYARSDTGPNIDPNNLPQARLVLTSTFSKEKNIYPQYLLYERSPMYNSKPIYVNYGKAISIKPEEEKEILLDAPKVVIPESYLLRIVFTDDSNRIISHSYDFRYVIKGESAKITKITFENIYDQNIIKSYIYGPADGTALEDVDVEVLVYDSNNILVDKSSKRVSIGANETIIEMPIEGISEGNANVEVIVSKNGTKLASKTEKLNLDISFEGENIKFTDIQGKKCEYAVKMLNGLGIISGYPDNTFRPENLITRAEVSTILTKLKNLSIKEGQEVPFWDISDHWAKDYICTIYRNGFVNGYPDGDFRPENNITYAETLTMLLNVLGYKNEVNSMSLDWPDNYVQKATELGLTEELEILDYWAPANRGDVSILTLKAYLLQ